MSGSESYQNIDKRHKFYDFIINDNIGSVNTSIKSNLDYINEHLDIAEFKRKFNGMIVGLSNYNYYMNDMLDYYSGTDSTSDNDSTWETDNYLVNYWSPTTLDVNDIIYRNNLSDFILNLIIDAVERKFNTGASPGFSNFYLPDNNPLAIPGSSFLVKLKSFLSGVGYKKNYNNMLNASNNYFVNTNYKNIFRNMLDLKIFDLYHYIVEIEQINDTTNASIYFLKNFIGMNILKYFFLSEMLLKILLDTKENIENQSDGDDPINQNDYTPLSEQLKKKHVINSDFDYDSVEFNTNKSVGMKLTYDTINSYSNYVTTPSILDPEIDAVYKIIKDIYFINKFIQKNTLILRNDNIAYITNPQLLTDNKKIEIDNLNQNITDINKNIVELNLKNLNIEKNYEKNRNMYYITLACVIIYIFLNIYVVWSGRTDSLLTLNAILIIVILLTKFFGLIKKSYQTLVKDLNN